MSKKKLTQLWAIICIVSVIAMFVLQFAFHWSFAWICPVIGVLACFIVSFIFGKDGPDE